jgi:hypothetical protein
VRVKVGSFSNNHVKNRTHEVTLRSKIDRVRAEGGGKSFASNKWLARNLYKNLYSRFSTIDTFYTHANNTRFVFIATEMPF